MSKYKIIEAIKRENDQIWDVIFEDGRKRAFSEREYNRVRLLSNLHTKLLCLGISEDLRNEIFMTIETVEEHEYNRGWSDAYRGS
jgi:hypothetical protein